MDDLGKKLEANLILIREDYIMSNPVNENTINAELLPFTYNILTNWNQIHQKVLDGIKHIVEVVKIKEDAISEYLRDATMAQATRANLALQKKVWRLSIVAVFIALLGFAQNFINIDLLEKAFYEICFIIVDVVLQ